MSANYKIQKPYVLAELPRPLGQAKRSYVVGEVYGHNPSHGKRKRPELVVGINGEAANLYDVWIDPEKGLALFYYVSSGS